jgi:hypothetical protein
MQCRWPTFGIQADIKMRNILRLIAPTVFVVPEKLFLEKPQGTQVSAALNKINITGIS